MKRKQVDTLLVLCLFVGIVLDVFSILSKRNKSNDQQEKQPTVIQEVNTWWYE